MFTRFRHTRTTPAVRDQAADVHLSPNDFIYPYFLVDGQRQKQTIGALPDVYRFSTDELLKDLERIIDMGINKILLFAVIDPKLKDETGSFGYRSNTFITQGIEAIKRRFPHLMLITDVCLCEYTSHGHCQIRDNDTTLPLLAQTALQHARAGADFVAPSAMMDGQVKAIKDILNDNELTTQILGYSAKYASAFYSPFRDAAGSAPAFGDRRSYQMDYRNARQGLDEIAADIAEGADWVMVKPALPYLDIVQQAHVAYPDVPLVAYQTSGEYAMLKAAAQACVLDEQEAFLETLTAIKRAGAKYIISYYLI